MKLIILDANVIIELFSLGIFDALIGRYSIQLPKTIKDESLFHYDQYGVEVQINWEPYISSGRVQEVGASDKEFGDLFKKLKDDFYRGIDAGELEAIALICSQDNEDLYFCSGDLPALKVMAVLGKGGQAVSLEALLQKAGMSRTLKHQFSEKRKTQEIAKAFSEKNLYLKF